MLPIIPDLPEKEQSWQWHMQHAFRDIKSLWTYLELPEADCPAFHSPFPIRVPIPFVERMSRKNPQDPLLRQVLLGHNAMPSTFSEDPLQEIRQSPQDGLLHKFHGRVLWIVTGACAVHCRYCFRQHFNYAQHVAKDKHNQMLAYLREHTEVREVILSGGDPLSFSDDKLFSLLQDLQTITHIRSIRIHTRFPVVIPQRLSTSLYNTLLQITVPITWVLHINHPLEISPLLVKNLSPFQEAGHWFFNQSVLLRGVNDCVDTLEELMWQLKEARIIPYYLHLLDQVRGAEAYDLPLEDARALYESLRLRLPGYLLPKMVQEIPDRGAKQPIELL